MKRYIKLAFLIPILVFTNCKLGILNDPLSVNIEDTSKGNGPLNLLARGMKEGFEGHNQMCWSAGLVGNEEISSIAANISQTPILIETQGRVPTDLGQNLTQAGLVYGALTLSSNARSAVEKSTEYSANAKNILLANSYMLDGIMYGDWAKFYEAGYELGTGVKSTPEQIRTLAIARLEEAAKRFATFAALTDDDNNKTRGLFTDGAMGVKFCNSFIGMLLFDTGSKAQAASYLSKGYTKADIGKEFGYKNSNILTTSGDAIYSAVASGVQFQFNQYSPNFRNNRIPLDTFRRVPSNWFAAQASLADNTVKMNYFYPAAPGTSSVAAINSLPTTSRLAYYPIISAAEVMLMQADPAVNTSVTKAQRDQVLTDVMTSWKMPMTAITPLLDDATITLDRVALYEYAGRGRRWAVGNKYQKWPLAVEFTFR